MTATAAGGATAADTPNPPAPEGRMEILLDDDLCTSLGMCESVAPDLFEIDDDGALVIHVVQPDESRRADVEAACAACPTGALSLRG